MKAKTSLFDLERPLQDAKKGGKKKKGKPADTPTLTEDQEMEMAKLQARVERIEKDVLFDRPLAEHEWRAKKVELEKDFIAKKQQAAKPREPAAEPPAEQPDAAEDASAEDNDDVTLEAQRMTAELLAQDDEEDDEALGDLFGNLPVIEVDKATGESSTVVNNSDGTRVTIRDFEKSAGMSPLRVLEEACRSR